MSALPVAPAIDMASSKARMAVNGVGNHEFDKDPRREPTTVCCAIGQPRSEVGKPGAPHKPRVQTPR
jgi:hypothetical protein